MAASNRISSTTGRRVGYVAFDLSDGESSAVVVCLVNPGDGYALRATPADVDVQIHARETGSGDPFVDIKASPIDLSGYTPDVPVQFDFKAVAAGALTDVRRVAVFIGVYFEQQSHW